jgi:hypothetical protein
VPSEESIFKEWQKIDGNLREWSFGLNNFFCNGAQTIQFRNLLIERSRETA